MNKYIFSSILALLLPVFVFALTKPNPDANFDNLSYAFYLYYDNGQIFADRDYEIKYEIIDEVYAPETTVEGSAYKAEIINFKSEVSKTFTFDPKKGNSSFRSGKIVVKGPYVTDGMRVQFYNNAGQPLISIFVNAGSICNDDDICNSAAGENEKSCTNDCKKSRPTPTPVVIEEAGFIEGLDMMTIITYSAGAAGILVLGWFIWRWRKKKKEESFLPPPSPPTSPQPLPPLN